MDAFITRENVNQLLAKSGFGPDLGILSVDIDGNDYHVLEALKCSAPASSSANITPSLGPCGNHSSLRCRLRQNQKAPFQPLLWSFARRDRLPREQKRLFVGRNKFSRQQRIFVRNDLMISQFPALDAEDGFTQSRFRDSRYAGGNLTYVSGEARLKLIQGLPVVNVETGAIDEL